VPAWQAFPEVRRVLVARLLSLLVERMVRSTYVPGGGAGGERDDEAAVGSGRGQDPELAP
jgi:hypothetical protein